MFIGRKTRPMGISTLGKVAKPALVANAKSIDFDGTNDYITIADHNSLSFGDGLSDSSFSVSAWIYMDEATKFRVVGKTKFDTYMEWLLTTDADDDLRLVLYDSTTSNFISQKTDSVLVAGQWYHVAATYNANEANTGIILYVDGSVAASSGSNVGSYTAMHSTSASVSIGQAKYSASTTDYANGNIDEVAIWSRALKASEIADIYNSKRMDLSQSSLSYSANNLVAWYRMGDGDTYPYIADRRKTFVTGKSIDFDGSNDHINCGNNYSFLDDPDANEFTISAWINADVGADGSIFSKADNSNRMVQLYTNTSDALIAKIGGTTISGATVVCDNTWKYVAIVVRNDGGTYKGQIYLNGSSDATEAAVSTTTATGMDFLIGARRNTDNTDLGYLFTGKITDVAIWDTALDANTVASIYNSGEPNNLLLSASYTASSGVDKTANLQAYYRMGNGTLDEHPLVADQTNATFGSEELTNNGFESGLTLAASWTAMDGWIDETVLSSQNANATLDTSNARTGSNCMKMELLSGSSYLNYGLTNLAAGVYKFSLFFKAGASQTIDSIRLGAATGLRGFALGDSGTISSISETYSEVVAYINNPSSQNVRFTISAGGTDSHFLFIDDISIKKVNGNPGVMTNMATDDVVELAPNRHTGTMTNMTSGDIETDVPS